MIAKFINNQSEFTIWTISYITHQSEAISTEWCLKGAGSFSTKPFSTLFAPCPLPHCTCLLLLPHFVFDISITLAIIQVVITWNLVLAFLCLTLATYILLRALHHTYYGYGCTIYSVYGPTFKLWQYGMGIQSYLQVNYQSLRISLPKPWICAQVFSKCKYCAE